jgi:hypothetical protein
MTVDDYCKAKLAGIAWRFRHISYPAMVAIMFCVRNRVQNSNWLPVLEKIERDLPATSETSDQRDPELTKVLETVDYVYDGSKADKLANGGTHWVETGKPLWWSEEVKERVASIAGLEIWK